MLVNLTVCNFVIYVEENANRESSGFTSCVADGIRQIRPKGLFSLQFISSTGTVKISMADMK